MVVVMVVVKAPRVRKRSGRRLRWLLYLLVALLLPPLSLWLLLRDLPPVARLADYRPALTSSVLDRNGELIGEFFEERRVLTPLDAIPDFVVGAFIAAEDSAFYEHRGIDYAALARAASAVLLAGGEKVQGGSTITQQVVKQLLLSPRKSYRRKLREVYLAQQVEDQYSKQHILYLYLNHIYFGSGAHGVGAAAQIYFDKTVGELSLSEAALLAGLPQRPSRYSPFHSPAAAEVRRRYVLNRMRDSGFISRATHARASANPPELAAPRDGEKFLVASYVTEEVRRRLVETLGNEVVLGGGLTIETTLDIALQREALRALREGIEALDRRRGYRGPLRRVTQDKIEALLPELARQNGLVAGTPLPAGFFEAARPGVVLRVDDETQRAVVAFGAGVRATVTLEDVAWAHAPTTELHGKTIEALSEALSIGDVDTFRLQRAPAFVGATDARAPDGQSALLATLSQHPDVQGALLSFDLETGDVLAMVGGYDFSRSEFNRAVQAQRQPGSAFKPIVYATALREGFTPATILYDRPVVEEDESSGFVFRPQNYGRRFLGPLTMAEALARSVNNATIHLLRDVGIDRVIEFSDELGIRSPLERVLGLALGASPVTLLEITRAYGVFGAGGRYLEPRLVLRVRDRDGKLLLENLPLDPALPTPLPVAAAPEPEEESEFPHPLEATAVVDAEPGADGDADVAQREVEPAEAEAPLPEGFVMRPTEAYLTTSLLRATVENPRGTGHRARRLRRPVAAKTGTTNDNTDAWFIGFTPRVATGVWVGIDAREFLGPGETGGRAAAPIWINYMERALAGQPASDFETPDGIVFARIDTRTGQLASAQSETTLFQAFIAGTEPQERADSPDTRQKTRRLRLDF